MKILKVVLLVLGLIIGLAAPSASGTTQSFLFTTVATFNTTNGGANPFAPPVLGPDGSLYGTTGFGNTGKGTNAFSVAYKISPDGTFTNLHNFATADGTGISAPLVFGNDGNLYGVANGGGANSLGTIFRLTTNGVFTVLYSFGIIINGQGYALDGSIPYAGLVQGQDGYFYGTTFSGGVYNVGTVFQFSTNGTLITLASFNTNNGAYPEETPLVEGSPGIFYGTTFQGGNSNNGTVFQVTSSGLVSNLHLFSGPDGSGPYNGLSFGTDGNLYGTTVSGGTKNDGTVYRISPNGTFTNLLSFNGTDGNAPESGVAMGTNDILYGTTFQGGAKNLGTVFQLATNGLISTIYSFTNGDDGVNPANGVILDAEGNLYGTTLNGGINKGRGTVFRLQPVPGLAITAPISGQRWSNSVFQVTGTASSNHGVTGVFYSLNGSGWTTASTTNGWTNWYAMINPTPGTNTIAAYAVDGSGSFSGTNTARLDYVVTAILTVSTNGQGSISPNLNNANLQIGTRYTLKARPARGFGFYYWNVGAALSNSPTLDFTMVANLVITANFKDITPPTISITVPKANEKYSNTLINVTGMASDNVGVTAVGVQVNSNGWVTAEGTNTWSASLPVASGANFIQAYAMDAAGNFSKTNEVKFLGELPPDWAPMSIAGATVLVVPNSGDPVTASFDATTFSQTDTLTNGDSGTGTYSYVQMTTNSAGLSLTFDAPLTLSNNTPQDIELDYTNLNEGTFTNFGSSDWGSFAVETATNFVPTRWSGHTVTTTNAGDTSVNVVKFTSATGYTLNSTTTGHYVADAASPIGVMLVLTNLSDVTYLQLTFVSKTGGHYEVNSYSEGSTNSDFGTFNFK